MSVHPEEINEGDEGHNLVHEEMAREWNRRRITVPCVVGGSVNNSPIIEGAIAEASPGDALWFPRGPIGIHRVHLTKALEMRGPGRFASWFVPLVDTDEPIVDMSLTVDSGYGPFANYGPAFKGLGLDLSAAPSATGIRTGGATSGWAEIEDFSIQGGAVAIDNQMPNVTIAKGVMSDATRFVTISDTGTEVALLNLVMQRVSPGTTECGIEMISTHGGPNGAIFIQNVRGNGNPNPASGVNVEEWMRVEAPSEASIPVFAEQLVLDNCSGPALVLVRAGDGTYVNCWFNGARGTNNGGVSIFGGIVNRFITSTFFGGPGGCSIDFVGGRPAHVSSVGNMLNTCNPAYRFPSVAADMPANLVARDVLADPLAVVCNQAVGFQVATGSWFLTPSSTPSALANGWTVTGAGYDAPYYRREGSLVSLGGTVQGGSAALIFNLPAGHRPAATKQFLVVGPAGAPVLVQVVANGNVQVAGTVPASLSLDGINFPVGG